MSFDSPAVEKMRAGLKAPESAEGVGFVGEKRPLSFSLLRPETRIERGIVTSLRSVLGVDQNGEDMTVYVDVVPADEPLTENTSFFLSRPDEVIEGVKQHGVQMADLTPGDGDPRRHCLVTVPYGNREEVGAVVFLGGLRETPAGQAADYLDEVLMKQARMRDEQAERVERLSLPIKAHNLISEPLARVVAVGKQTEAGVLRKRLDKIQNGKNDGERLRVLTSYIESEKDQEIKPVKVEPIQKQVKEDLIKVEGEKKEVREKLERVRSEKQPKNKLEKNRDLTRPGEGESLSGVEEPVPLLEKVYMSACLLGATITAIASIGGLILPRGYSNILLYEIFGGLGLILGGGVIKAIETINAVIKDRQKRNNDEEME